jgi:hypothetical protein
VLLLGWRRWERADAGVAFPSGTATVGARHETHDIGYPVCTAGAEEALSSTTVELAKFVAKVFWKRSPCRYTRSIHALGPSAETGGAVGVRADSCLTGPDSPQANRTAASSDRFLPDGMTLDQWEDEMIREALKRAGGNKSQAARLLGLSRNALRYRLSKIGIDDNEAECIAKCLIAGFLIARL